MPALRGVAIAFRGFQVPRLAGRQRGFGARPNPNARRGAPVLEVADIATAYGKIEALKGVSLSAGKGRITCLLGPNGAGKTTLMLTIAGILKPRRGSIRLDGQEIAGLSSARIVARGLALVPENRLVFPQMSVRENLEAGAFQRRNFALARTAAEAFLGEVDRARVAAVAAGVEIPGRLERVGSDPPAYLDAAHNPDGARALAEALPGLACERPVIACLAVLADKDARAMIQALAPVLTHAVCTARWGNCSSVLGSPKATSRSEGPCWRITPPNPCAFSTRTCCHRARTVQGA